MVCLYFFIRKTHIRAVNINSYPPMWGMEVIIMKKEKLDEWEIRLAKDPGTHDPTPEQKEEEEHAHDDDWEIRLTKDPSKDPSKDQFENDEWSIRNALTDERYYSDKDNVLVKCLIKIDGSGELTLYDGKNEIFVQFASITALDDIEINFIGWAEADVDKASEAINEILERIPGCDIEIARDEEQEVPEHEELSNDEIEQDDAGVEDIETDDHDEIGL